MRINWALGTVSIRKLKIVGSLSMNAQPAWIRNNTDRGRREVVEHDTHGTSRGLSEARVAEADLLKQVSVVTEHCGGILRARERRDGVSLEIAAIGSMGGSVREWNRQTVFPMRRTGCASFLGTYGASCSTERTGHPYEV